MAGCGVRGSLFGLPLTCAPHLCPSIVPLHRLTTSRYRRSTHWLLFGCVSTIRYPLCFASTEYCMYLFRSLAKNLTLDFRVWPTSSLWLYKGCVCVCGTCIGPHSPRSSPTTYLSYSWRGKLKGAVVCKVFVRIERLRTLTVFGQPSS